MDEGETTINPSDLIKLNTYIKTVLDNMKMVLDNMKIENKKEEEKHQNKIEKLIIKHNQEINSLSKTNSILKWWNYALTLGCLFLGFCIFLTLLFYFWHSYSVSKSCIQEPLVH